MASVDNAFPKMTSKTDFFSISDDPYLVPILPQKYPKSPLLSIENNEGLESDDIGDFYGYNYQYDYTYQKYQMLISDPILPSIYIVDKYPSLLELVPTTYRPETLFPRPLYIMKGKPGTYYEELTNDEGERIVHSIANYESFNSSSSDKSENNISLVSRHGTVYSSMRGISENPDDNPGYILIKEEYYQGLPTEGHYYLVLFGDNNVLGDKIPMVHIEYDRYGYISKLSHRIINDILYSNLITRSGFGAGLNYLQYPWVTYHFKQGKKIGNETKEDVNGVYSLRYYNDKEEIMGISYNHGELSYIIDNRKVRYNQYHQYIESLPNYNKLFGGVFAEISMIIDQYDNRRIDILRQNIKDISELDNSIENRYSLNELLKLF